MFFIFCEVIWAVKVENLSSHGGKGQVHLQYRMRMLTNLTTVTYLMWCIVNNSTTNSLMLLFSLSEAIAQLNQCILFCEKKCPLANVNSPFSHSILAPGLVYTYKNIKLENMKGMSPTGVFCDHFPADP